MQSHVFETVYNEDQSLLRRILSRCDTSCLFLSVDFTTVTSIYTL